MPNMAPVVTRTYDTITLPGSARTSRVLVAAVGQDIHRERLQLMNQQLVGNAAYTRPTVPWNGGGIAQPAATGGSNPYNLVGPGEESDQAAGEAGPESVGLRGLSSGGTVGASERGAPPEEEAKPTSSAHRPKGASS